MTDVMTGSTVPRRQLGRYLRELRNQNGLTIKRAAAELEWSEVKIWRIETGQVAMRSLDVQGMCQFYGADQGLTAALMGLAKETKARGWWHAYGDVIPDGFDVYIGLEEAAAAIDWYEANLIPGLLQTEDYARTLIRAYRSDVADEEVDRRVQVRVARQRLLTRATAPPRLHIVLDEAILRRPVGGPAVMAAQLRHIAEACDLPSVSLRVVPFSAGFHQGIQSGAFEILRFPSNGEGQDKEPPTVFVDGFMGDLYLDKPAEVDHHARAFAEIWTLALEERISRTIIRQAAKELAP
jgi:transcriptional regulator with XRE-family HTH domain